MSSIPTIAGRTLRYRTLRYWTINSQEFVGGSQRLAPALPYSEQADGGQFHRLAAELTRVKSEIARRTS